MRRVFVRGTSVDIAAPDEAISAVAARAAAGGGYVCLANVHVVETARRSRDVAAALADAAFVFPDGAPVAFVARLSGTRARRIAGSDLFDSLLRTRALRHFLVGGTEEILARVTAEVRRRHPEAALVGSVAPPFAAADQFDVASLADAVNAVGATVVWVGLGAPKQELVMQRLAPLVPAVLIGVGAVFDFVAGTRRRAPRALQRVGLEWAFRLVQEPRRLGRRYLTTNTSFVAGVIGDSIRRSRV